MVFRLIAKDKAIGLHDSKLNTQISSFSTGHSTIHINTLIIILWEGL